MLIETKPSGWHQTGAFRQSNNEVVQHRVASQSREDRQTAQARSGSPAGDSRDSARRLAGDRDCLFQLSHPGEDLDTADHEPVRFASVATDGGVAAEEVREAADAVRAGDLGFGFYAGLPLRTADGHRLGTLALVDPEPRTIGEVELDSLKLLASIVVDLLELRLAARAKVAAAGCEIS